MYHAMKVCGGKDEPPIWSRTAFLTRNVANMVGNEPNMKWSHGRTCSNAPIDDEEA